MYALYAYDDEIWQITLPKPELKTLPFARPNNVYLVGKTHPTLINAGHPGQYRALCAALREVGVSPSEIVRVIATSWSVDSLGGITNFPNADAFVFSPDMRQPAAYAQWVDARREELRELVEELRQRPAYAHIERAELDGLLDGFYPHMPDQLRFIPLRSGHIVRAGPLELEVVSTPGPDAGHISLFEPERRLLFAGDLTRDGLPDVIADVQAYLTSMERVLILQPEALLPNYGVIDPLGTFTIRRSLRFLNNFLSNAPLAMKDDPPDLVELVERDLGFQPRDGLRFAATLLAYRAFLDELVRTRIISATGSGLSRRYGVGLDDPRAEVL